MGSLLCAVSIKQFFYHDIINNMLTVELIAHLVNSLIETPMVVFVPDVNAPTLRLIVEYMYTSQMKLTPSNVTAVRKVADVLQLKDLSTACIKHLGRLVEDDMKIKPLYVLNALCTILTIDYLYHGKQPLFQS